METYEVRKIVIDYWQRKKKQKRYDEQMKILKSNFDSVMSEYFDSHNLETSVVFENEHSMCVKENQLKVSKIQNTKIVFFPEKIKKALGKRMSKKAIDKRYEIIDYRGLVEYLKELDADPKIFRQFILVEETVNSECLDYMVETGEIDEKQLSGCYEVKLSEPYFKVVEVGGKSWESAEPF